MALGEASIKTLEQHRVLEAELHRELMNICRKYVNDLGIISLMGMLDIVKQETIELEKAKRKIIKDEKPEVESKGIG